MTPRNFRRQLVCTLGVLSLFCGTGCPPSIDQVPPGGQQTPVGEQITQASSAVADSARTGLDNGLGQQALDNAVALAKQQPGVQDAYLSLDGFTIIMKFNDGRIHYVLTQTIDSPVEQIAPKRKHASGSALLRQSKTRASNGLRTIGPKTAAIYSPFQDQLKYDLDEISASLVSAGFTINDNGDPLRWTNANADLNALQSILEDNYGVIIILTHGWLGENGKGALATGQSFIDSLNTGPWGGDTNVESVTIEDGRFYSVTPSFVAKYAHADSVVLLLACESLSNDATLARAFLDHGACGCIGFSRVTSVPIAQRAAKLTVKFLCEGDTIPKAVERTRSDPFLANWSFRLKWFPDDQGNSGHININNLIASPIDSDCTIINKPPFAASQPPVTVPHNGTKLIILEATDPNGDFLTYSATKPDHGELGTIVSDNVLYTPDPGFSGEDHFTFKVNDGYVDSNTVTVTLTVAGPDATNTAPVVDAGQYQPIQWPTASVALNGTVTDDGLPSPTLTYVWSKLSGPGTVTFGTPNAEDTTAQFGQPGIYTLVLSAYDGELLAEDSVVITINGSQTTASFQGLGFLSFPSLGSRAQAVSADGTVVVGGSSIQAFRYSNGTMVGLGIPPGFVSAFATAVSNNGSVVVGYCLDAGGDPEAFRWEAGQMSTLGFLPGHDESRADGVSGDGSVVVGHSNNIQVAEAFRWSNGTMIGLGSLSSDANSEARGISADGNEIVGNAWDPIPGSTDGDEAFRWAGGTMSGLGFLPGGTILFSEAFAISADGSVIVGDSTNSQGKEEAFRWSGGVMNGLGLLPGNSDKCRPRAVSADGSVIVGINYSDSTSTREAFIWDAARGLRSLKDELVTNQGLTNVLDWTLEEALGISADGKVIVGHGKNPQDKFEAWRAVLGP